MHNLFLTIAIFFIPFTVVYSNSPFCSFSSDAFAFEAILKHHLEEENLDSIQFLYDELLHATEGSKKGLVCFYYSEALLYDEDIANAIVVLKDAYQYFSDANCPIYAAHSLGKLGNLYLLERNFDEATKHCNALCSLTEKEQMDSFYVEALIQKANLLEIKSRPKSAQQSLQQAAIIAEKTKNYPQLQNIYTASGTQFQATGIIDSAIIAYQKLIHVDSLLKDELSLLTDFNSLGNLLKLQGTFEQAQIYFFKAINIAEIEKDSLAMMNIYSDVGEVYLAQKIYAKARQYSQQSLKIAFRQNIKMQQAKNYKTLAYIEEGQNNQKAAINFFQQALIVYQELRNKQYTSEIQLRLANTYKNENALEEAQSLLEETIIIKKEIKDEIGLLTAQNTLAEIFYRQQKYNKSITLLKDALQKATTLHNREGLLNTYKLLSNNHEQLKQFKEALIYQKKYRDMSDSITSGRNVQIIDNISTKYESEKKEKVLIEKEAELSRQEIIIYKRNDQIIYLSIGLFTIFISIFLLAFKNTQIRKEQEKSETLLLNILPANIAQELKETGKAKARRHENVTVFFSDFKDFVKIAGTMSPEKLVAEVDFCFSYFDQVMEHYGLEKIKTIGDAYMCIGGINQDEKAAIKMIQAAIDIQRFLNQTAIQKKLDNQPFFEARIGIHTGSVIAGIVGSKKFAYDVWGDTVNTASRLESASEVGQINISQVTYQLVRTHFDCESRGKITVKNIGEVEMYFVKYG